MQDSAGGDLADRKVIRGNRFYLAGMVLVNVATLISILLCPGNAGRNAVSIADLPILRHTDLEINCILVCSVLSVYLLQTAMLYF